MTKRLSFSIVSGAIVHSIRSSCLVVVLCFSPQAPVMFSQSPFMCCCSVGHLPLLLACGAPYPHSSWVRLLFWFFFAVTDYDA